MQNYFNKKMMIAFQFLLVMGFWLVFQLSLVTNNRDVKIYLIPPPPQLEHFSFGFQEVIADLLWIRSIQDFDYCERKITKIDCKNNGWLYQMLDTITDLSPHFRMPYATGGLALTVLVSDIKGATLFFEKAVKAFPTDWPILYRAAYHMLYEERNKLRAGELLSMAAKQQGAPPWLPVLAGRMFTESNNVELAEQLLQEMKEVQGDPIFIKSLEEKIKTYKSKN